MNRAILTGIVAGLVLGAVSTAYTASLEYGDDRLIVNDSPVLTVATSGGLTGQIVSATASIANGTSGTVYTTPATGEFVLTQMCVSFPGDYLSGALTGSTIGPIARYGYGGYGSCTEYRPGYAIPAGESLIGYDDTSTGGPTVFSITGVYAPATKSNQK